MLRPKIQASTKTPTRTLALVAGWDVVLFVGCLTSQQHASVSQGRICLDKFTCCHSEIEVADQTFYLTESQYTDTGSTSPSTDPISPGAWQGSHWSGHTSHWYDSARKYSHGATTTRWQAMKADVQSMTPRVAPTVVLGHFASGPVVVAMW